MERVGLRRARRLGPRGSGDRSPTLRELRDGLRGYLVVRICLDEPVGRRRRQVARRAVTPCGAAVEVTGRCTKPSDGDRMLKVLIPPHGCWVKARIGNLAGNQPLVLGGRERHWLEFIPCVSSRDGPWRV
jgi:hypothetical protein